MQLSYVFWIRFTEAIAKAGGHTKTIRQLLASTSEEGAEFYSYLSISNSIPTYRSAILFLPIDLQFYSYRHISNVVIETQIYDKLRSQQNLISYQYVF